MANIINITEKNNRLEFSDTYAPIVCGNSNYVFKFNFGEQWQNCNRKAAFFVIDGNKLTVDFEGDECKVPVLPNAAYVLVSLVSGEGENQLATTPIKIRLEPTMAGGDFSEFNQLANYLPKILSALNAIENGEVVAKKAENATTANVAETANNVSNPNLLINGNFVVNQRGQSEYAASGYTVDRWRQTEAKTVVNDDKSITISNFKNYGRLVQQLEDVNGLKGKTVTLSVKFKNVSYTTEADPRIIIHDGITNTISSTIPNGFSGIVSVTKTIAENATSLSARAVHNHLVATNSDLSVTIEWAKLEIGETATEFCPRLYAEELGLCQRFYWKSTAALAGNHSGFNIDSQTARFSIIMPREMRTVPTISEINLSSIAVLSGGNQYTPSSIQYQEYSNNNSTNQITYSLTVKDIPANKTNLVRLLQPYGLDAEIY